MYKLIFNTEHSSTYIRRGHFILSLDQCSLMGRHGFSQLPLQGLPLSLELALLLQERALLFETAV